MNCLVCCEKIPVNMVQERGCHMDCYHKPMTVYKVIFAGTSFLEKDPYHVLEILCSEGDENQYIVKKIEVASGYYMNLPEFDGF